MQRARPGPHGRAKLRSEPSPPPATPSGSRPQAHPRAPQPAPSLSFLEKVPSCGAQPDTGRSPRSLVSEAWRLQGPQPAQPARGWEQVISLTKERQLPRPPSPCCPILQFAPCLYPPEGGQQDEPEPRKGSSPEAQRGGKARGPPTRPPPPPLPGRLRVPCSVLRLWCLGAGLPEQGGQQGWPGREGSTASAEPLEERWKDLREGFQKQKECQRHRPQPGSSPASGSPGCGPRPQGSH